MLQLRNICKWCRACGLSMSTIGIPVTYADCRVSAALTSAALYVLKQVIVMMLGSTGRVEHWASLCCSTDHPPSSGIDCTGLRHCAGSSIRTLTGLGTA